MVGHSEMAGCWCLLCRNRHPKAREKAIERRRLKRRERQRWKRGSKVEIIVGVVPASSAPQPMLVHLDEVEQMDPEIWERSRLD